MTVELQEALRLRARQLSKNVSDLSPADIDYVEGLMDKSSDSGGGSQAVFAQALQIRADQLSVNVRDFTQAERDYVQELLDEGSLVVPRPKKSHKKKKAKVAKVAAEPEAVKIEEEVISTTPKVIDGVEFKSFNFPNLGTTVIPEEESMRKRLSLE